MALRLPRFQAGRPITDEVTAEKLNQIVDAIHQCELQGGVGYDVTRGPGGATLAIRRDNMIPSSQLGAAYVIGPPSTGVAQDGTLIGPGEPTPAWSVKRPGSDVFEPIYVFGENSYIQEYVITSCSNISLERVRYLSGITLSDSDVIRYVGLMTSYQGMINQYWGDGAVGWGTECPCLGDPSSGPCSSVADPCGGNNYTFDYYWPPGPQYSAAGAFGELSDGCSNGTGQTGLFVFRCIFDIGSISPSQIKLRFRLQTSSVFNANTTITSIQLNSQAAAYSPSGTFSTLEGFNETREISEGFISGANTLDLIANHGSGHVHPGIRCEFEPTTAQIVSKNSSGDVANFSSLTDAQIDLIGLGTPVRALSSGTAYIWSYSGTGDKRSSASYTRLREA